jgi:5S rRNA maturation endonuclease (ribonuclease M5)
MNATPTEKILSALAARNCDPKQNGNGWSAHCPAHNDQRPSLSISEGEGGRALVRCHAGCTVESICDAVGLCVADLCPDDSSTLSTSTQFRESREKGQNRRQSDGNSPAYATADEAIAALERRHGESSVHWTYLNADGDPVGVVVRWDTAEGKEIRPVSRQGDCWVIGGLPEPRPLYALPELRNSDRVYICEGEEAANALRALGLTATTSTYGSQSADKTDWSPLAGKECVILPDNDEAGSKYADAVARALSQLSPSTVVKEVHLPNLPEHGDIADCVQLQPGVSAEDSRHAVEAMADDAEAIQPDSCSIQSSCFVGSQLTPFPNRFVPMFASSGGHRVRPFLHCASDTGMPGSGHWQPQVRPAQADMARTVDRLGCYGRRKRFAQVTCSRSGDFTPQTEAR